MSVPPRTLLREPLQSNGAQRWTQGESATQPGKTGVLAKLRPVPKEQDQNREPSARTYAPPARGARPAADTEKSIHANPFMQRARADKARAEPVARSPTPKSGTRTGGESSFSSAKRMFSNPASSESSVMVRSKSSRRDMELGRMRLSRPSLATLAQEGAAPAPTPAAGGARLRDAERDHQAYEYLCHCSEAQQWIERCIGEPLGGDIANMGEEMRNGIALAKLAKSFEPGCVPRIFVHPRLQFRHTDNINYLSLIHI